MASFASLSFEPVQYSVTQGVPFELALNVFSDSQPVISTDSFILYDPRILRPVLPVKSSGMFEQVDAKIVEPGKLYIFGIRTNKSLAQMANGEFAKITFEPLQSGKAELLFDCSPGKTSTSQIIHNSASLENIINCERTVNHTAHISIAKGNVLGTSDNLFGINSMLLGTVTLVTLAITYMLYVRFRKLETPMT